MNAEVLRAAVVEAVHERRLGRAVVRAQSGGCVKSISSTVMSRPARTSTMVARTPGAIASRSSADHSRDPVPVADRVAHLDVRGEQVPVGARLRTLVEVR